VADLAAARVISPSVPTNIVLIETDRPADAVVREAAELGVLVAATDAHRVRCVTHLEISERDARFAVEALHRVLAA